ncbi:hypothetical protein B0H19DRAFT_1384643 [Mycena capillaripes]|nr:hypothetical protein B0H19DRAFT_1384643 [Mycena capillaripes]
MPRAGVLELDALRILLPRSSAIRSVAFAGVVGLSTAIRVLEAGYDVTLFAEVFPTDPKTVEYTSFWAGAICRPGLGNSLSSRLEKETMHIFAQMVKEDPNVPIATHPIFGYTEVANPEDRKHDAEMKELFPDFRVLDPNELPHGIASGVAFTIFFIDVPQYLAYLWHRFFFLGGRAFRSKLSSLSDLLSPTTGVRLGFEHVARDGNITELTSGSLTFNASALVNCTGLGALSLGDVNDTAMFPTRGETVLGPFPSELNFHYRKIVFPAKEIPFPQRCGNKMHPHFTRPQICSRNDAGTHRHPKKKSFPKPFPQRCGNGSNSNHLYPFLLFNSRPDLSARIKGLCNISLLVRYAHQPRRGLPPCAAPPHLSTPYTSLPNDCVGIARPRGPARVRATTPVSRPPAPARAPSTMPLPPQKLRPHCVPLRPRRRPRRHARPVPSRLAAASTPRARPLLTPRCCCALSPCAARPVPSHPTLAAFRGSPLRAHPVPSTVPSTPAPLRSTPYYPQCTTTMRIMMPTPPIHLLPVKCRRSLSLLCSPAALSPFKASPCYCSGIRRLHSRSRSFFGSSSAPLHERNAQAKTYGSLAALLPFRSTLIVEYLDGNLQLCSHPAPARVLPASQACAAEVVTSTIPQPRARDARSRLYRPRCSALPDCDTLPSAHARYQAHTISRTRAPRLLPRFPPRFVHRDYLARNRASHNPPISPPVDTCTGERAGYNLAVPSSSFSHSASSPASTAAPSSHNCTQDRTLIRRSLPLFTPKTRRVPVRRTRCPQGLLADPRFDAFTYGAARVYFLGWTVRAFEPQSH